MTEKSTATSEVLAQYQQDLERQGRAPGTVHGYVIDLEQFAQWHEDSVGGPFAPSRVVPLDVRSYCGYLQTVQGRSPATINRRLQALRSFFRWAHGQGLVKEDPSAGAKTVPSTRKQFAPKAISRQQVHRLLRESQAGRHPARDYALLQIMVQAGLRVAEVASLNVDDVEIGPRSGRVRVRSGKGGKERAVPLNATARKAVEEYKKKRPAVAGVSALFVSQKGRPMSARAIERVVEQCARQAGLADEGVSAHTLRHTFATSYLEKNPGQLVELATLLGHADLNTTAVYTQPSFAHVAQKLEESPLNLDR